MPTLINLDDVFSARAKLIEEMRDNERAIQTMQLENARIAAIKDEYDITLRVLEAHQVPTGPYEFTENGVEEAAQPYGSQRRKIEAALYAHAQEGASVSTIKDYIQKRFSTEISPNTISVTLSRFKDRGTANLKGLLWFPNESRDAVDENERRSDRPDEDEEDPPF